MSSWNVKTIVCYNKIIGRFKNKENKNLIEINWYKKYLISDNYQY